ncbi:MAG: pyridoxal-phosphate dependent enzyme [Candidatus Aminicenantes bacterium]|nr:pyridoxal-phosphate dependent enzyme [Candidatus Aminicenantes bacterium]
MDFRAGVESAYDRIKDDILRTELAPEPGLSRRAGRDVLIKWESRQRTGSFKIRGALNKIRSLRDAPPDAVLVSASTGNHGLAMAWASERESRRLVLFLPATVAPHKLARLRGFPALLERRGASCEESEILARRWAAATGGIFVSPYNDPDVVFGQGTIGLEIAADAPALAHVVVPVGGGGLAAGIAGFLKAVRPGVRIHGVEPAASAFMAASVRAGRIVSFPEGPSAADAVAGGIEPGSITFDLCRSLVDDWIAVGEDALREAVVLLDGLGRGPVEPAGALALAGLRAAPDRFGSGPVALIVSGGNTAGRPAVPAT